MGDSPERREDEAAVMALPGPEAGREAMLSIGALSRASGIPIETLRTWERRYGFPLPARKPSGHRVYPVSAVPRLRRIAAALARGHRAAQVVGASDAELAALLASCAGVAPRGPGVSGPIDVDRLLAAVTRFDGDTITRGLRAAWERRSPLDFLRSCVAVLIRRVGEEWSVGRLDIAQEHFFSERVADVLRALRLPLDDRADGPVVVLATLPGETHLLGLQMVALLFAALGWRVLCLGTEVPPAQVAALASETGARAIGLSISLATGRTLATSAQVAELRRLVPAATELVVGGEGAASVRGADMVLTDLADLEAWARTRRAS